MSFCKKEGKDKRMFMTKEELSTPSTSSIQNHKDEEEPGAIFPNGEINWHCPCIGGMLAAPCGVEYRESIKCMFGMREGKYKATECLKLHQRFIDCSRKYPEVYGRLPSLEDDTDNDNGDMGPQKSIDPSRTEKSDVKHTRTSNGDKM